MSDERSEESIGSTVLLGETVETWDDKKEKYNSWEASILIDCWNVCSDWDGQCLVDIRVTGWGATEAEAIAALGDKVTKFETAIQKRLSQNAALCRDSGSERGAQNQ